MILGETICLKKFSISTFMTQSKLSENSPSELTLHWLNIIDFELSQAPIRAFCAKKRHMKLLYSEGKNTRDQISLIKKNKSLHRLNNKINLGAIKS